MPRFSRRRISALLLAALLLSTTTPLAAAPADGGEPSPGLFTSFVQWGLDTLRIYLLRTEPAVDGEGGGQSTTSTTAEDDPPGHAELGGHIDPDG